LKYKVIRSGLRVVGWGELPEIGGILEDDALPESLRSQLLAQKIIEPVAQKRVTRSDSAASAPELE